MVQSTEKGTHEGKFSLYSILLLLLPPPEVTQLSAVHGSSMRVPRNLILSPKPTGKPVQHFQIILSVISPLVFYGKTLVRHSKEQYSTVEELQRG